MLSADRQAFGLAVRDDLHVVPLPGGGVLVFGEGPSRWLSGRLFETLVPLLDGTRTEDELASELADTLGRAEVHFAVGRLRSWGLLRPEPRPTTTVAISAVGGLDPAPFQAALEAAGRHTDGPADLRLVLVDDYLNPDLQAIDAEQRATGQPWLLVRPRGTRAWLGPRLTPGEGPCWSCLAHRLEANQPLHAVLRTLLDAPRTRWPARLDRPARIAAVAALVGATLEDGAATLADTLVELDATGLVVARHAVVQRPQCPACGDPSQVARAQERPLALVPRPKTFTADGGHRVAHPSETLDRHGHHVSALTGVVEALDVVRTPGVGATEVPLVDSGRNLSRPRTSLADLKAGFRAHSYGKGASLVQARASGLCEAIERHAAVFQGDEARRRARLGELDGQVHPDAILRFSEAQLGDPAAWNARHLQRSHQVPPERFDPERPIEWTPATGLGDGERRLVPTALCFYDYPHEADHRFGFACSNGTAAGNTAEEAVVQGLLELVERDAVALWWYSRARVPAVDLASLDAPYLREIEALHDRLERDLWLLDLTHDLGIPVYAAASRWTDGGPEGLAFGFGAHLDPKIAALRAVTELNQMLPFALGLRDGTLGRDTDAYRWLGHASLARDPYLAPDPARQVRSATDVPRLWSDDLLDDVTLCVDRIRAVGIEPLAIDLTRPDVGLPVVRVFAPGLRHFWPRLGPGRLYDVPEALGWVPRRLDESELNPVPVFF